MVEAPVANPKADRSWIYVFCRAIVRVLSRVCFRWRIHHVGRVPATGPIIIASNHVSYLDPPLIGSAIERTVHPLARKTLFSIPLFGALIRQLNALPVDRDGGGGAGLKTILEHLRHGAAIILFPEGTRSPDGRPIRAKAGIGLAVIKSDALVVPVRCFGTYEAAGIHRTFPRPYPIDLVFGEPLDFRALRAEAKSCDKARLKAIYQEVADGIMAAIAALEPPGGRRVIRVIRG